MTTESEIRGILDESLNLAAILATQDQSDAEDKADKDIVTAFKRNKNAYLKELERVTGEKWQFGPGTVMVGFRRKNGKKGSIDIYWDYDVMTQKADFTIEGPIGMQKFPKQPVDRPASSVAPKLFFGMVNKLIGEEIEEGVMAYFEEVDGELDEAIQVKMSGVEPGKQQMLYHVLAKDPKSGWLATKVVWNGGPHAARPWPTPNQLQWREDDGHETINPSGQAMGRAAITLAKREHAKRHTPDKLEFVQDEPMDTVTEVRSILDNRAELGEHRYPEHRVTEPLRAILWGKLDGYRVSARKFATEKTVAALKKALKGVVKAAKGLDEKGRSDVYKDIRGLRWDLEKYRGRSPSYWPERISPGASREGLEKAKREVVKNSQAMYDAMKAAEAEVSKMLGESYYYGTDYAYKPGRYAVRKIKDRAKIDGKLVPIEITGAVFIDSEGDIEETEYKALVRLDTKERLDYRKLKNTTLRDIDSAMLEVARKKAERRHYGEDRRAHLEALAEAMIQGYLIPSPGQLGKKSRVGRQPTRDNLIDMMDNIDDIALGLKMAPADKKWANRVHLLDPTDSSKFDAAMVTELMRIHKKYFPAKHKKMGLEHVDEVDDDAGIEERKSKRTGRGVDKAQSEFWGKGRGGGKEKKKAFNKAERHGKKSDIDRQQRGEGFDSVVDEVRSIIDSRT